MNRRQFLMVCGGAMALAVVPKSVIKYPQWMAEETGLLVHPEVRELLLPGARSLLSVDAWGCAEENLHAMVAVARKYINGEVHGLLQCGVNAYGGLASWTVGRGEEIFDMPQAPLAIASSSPLLKWRATYRNPNGTIEIVTGAGHDVTHKGIALSAPV